MILTSYWVVSDGIRWFQLVLDRFRPFLVLVRIDLMCSLLCKTLRHIDLRTKL